MPPETARIEADGSLVAVFLNLSPYTHCQLVYVLSSALVILNRKMDFQRQENVIVFIINQNLIVLIHYFAFKPFFNF